MKISRLVSVIWCWWVCLAWIIPALPVQAVTAYTETQINDQADYILKWADENIRYYNFTGNDRIQYLNNISLVYTRVVTRINDKIKNTSSGMISPTSGAQKKYGKDGLTLAEIYKKLDQLKSNMNWDVATSYLQRTIGLTAVEAKTAYNGWKNTSDIYKNFKSKVSEMEAWLTKALGEWLINTTNMLEWALKKYNASYDHWNAINWNNIPLKTLSKEPLYGNGYLTETQIYEVIDGIQGNTTDVMAIYDFLEKDYGITRAETAKLITGWRKWSSLYKEFRKRVTQLEQAVEESLQQGFSISQTKKWAFEKYGFTQDEWNAINWNNVPSSKSK